MCNVLCQHLASIPLHPAHQAVDTAKAKAPASRTKQVEAVKEVPAAGSVPTSEGNGLVPRTRSQTAAARQQATGMSMSSLLESRSAAMNSRKSLTPASPMPDIDSQDRMNPLAASDYVNDIYNYYKRVENKYRVAPTYMSSQVCVGLLLAPRGP